MKDKLSWKLKIELYFENTIWKLRWSAIVAVFFSAITAIMMFYVASVDTYYVIHELMNYAYIDDIFDRQHTRAEAIGHIVQVVDAFLLAIVLLIFSYGTYELYIGRIDQVQEDESAKHLLRTRDLDHLKNRLGKVILMILIVKFFEISLAMGFNDIKELTAFALAIACISFSFFLTERSASYKNRLKTHKGDFENPRNKILEEKT